MPLPLNVSWFSKIQIALPFWYRLTRVVPEKGLLNGCVCVPFRVRTQVGTRADALGGGPGPSRGRGNFDKPSSGPLLTRKHARTHTCLMTLFQGLPRWAGTRKVKPIWILLKQERVSGNSISWATCKSAPRSRQITMPAFHLSGFLQAGCPSYRPTNSVKALLSIGNIWHEPKVNSSGDAAFRCQYCSNLLLTFLLNGMIFWTHHKLGKGHNVSSCAKHSTVESYTVIYAADSHSYYHFY